MSQKILLEIPDNLYENLAEIAKIRGQSLENLAIQCLNELKNKNLENDSLEEFIGAFNSNNSDWLENHDFYLGKSVTETNE